MKKRYKIAAVLCAGLFATCQMEFMKFRKSEDEQLAYLKERGQSNVQFGTYQVDGRSLHYSQSGADGLPLVLVVHGSPGSSKDALEYLADTSLTRQAKVMVVDRPGYGYSDFGKTERSLGLQARQLVALLERYRAPGQKAILVGHSFGGPLIARMAMDFPDVVDGLVIVAGSIDPALEPEFWWSHPIDWWIFRWMLPPAFRVSNQEILPLKTELQNMLPFWADIRIPVTVVQGTKDSLVPAGNADFAKKMLVNSSKLDVVMLDGEDHFIMWTREKLIAEKIIEQLNETTVASENHLIKN